MNIGQIARNQQMLFNFFNRSNDYASQIQFPSANDKTQIDTKYENKFDADSLLNQMGLSNLEGRTIREMAKYKLETQKTLQPVQSYPSTDIRSLTQQIYNRTLYTPLSDKTTKSIQQLALKDAENSVGQTTAADRLERISLIQEELDNFAPSKRAAAFNTINKVWESELDRIGEFIKEREPSWEMWGDKFDTSILKDYQPGVNLWV